MVSYISPGIIEDTRAQGDRHASGTIIANSIQSCQGSAIIKSINGEYVGNSLFSNSKVVDANGGVIANYVESSKNNDIAQIGNIKAYFSGNYVMSNKNSAYGGVMSNFYIKSDSYYKNAIIDSINSTFENNYAKTESTDSTKGAYGGAIANIAIIKAINNSVFKNNYAISDGGSNASGVLYILCKI